MCTLQCAGRRCEKTKRRQSSYFRQAFFRFIAVKLGTKMADVSRGDHVKHVKRKTMPIVLEKSYKKTNKEHLNVANNLKQCCFTHAETFTFNRQLHLLSQNGTQFRRTPTQIVQRAKICILRSTNLYCQGQKSSEYISKDISLCINKICDQQHRTHVILIATRSFLTSN